MYVLLMTSVFDYIASYTFSLYIGTLLYCPPEFFKHKSYKLVPSTVWTMGLVMYIMLQGRNPFNSEAEIVEGKIIVEKPISKGEYQK